MKAANDQMRGKSRRPVGGWGGPRPGDGVGGLGVLLRRGGNRGEHWFNGRGRLDRGTTRAAATIETTTTTAPTADTDGPYAVGIRTLTFVDPTRGMP